MQETVFYLPIATPVMRRVRQKLLDRGVHICDTPENHVTHLLLGVPSLEEDGSIKNGDPLSTVLKTLPENITVVGGNLEHPLLEGHKKIDLLQDESYLWENAAITADCAISLARQRMHRQWKETPVLITGFGRIGFHLASMLRSLGAEVTVAARKDSVLAQAASMGLNAVYLNRIDAGPYDVIFNTVPSMVLPEERCKGCSPDCIKMDLASRPGIGGSGVVWARGLPGKYAPESAGELIVKNILQEVRI